MQSHLAAPPNAEGGDLQAAFAPDRSWRGEIPGPVTKEKAGAAHAIMATATKVMPCLANILLNVAGVFTRSYRFGSKAQREENPKP
jgi:hypothetical protein